MEDNIKAVCGGFLVGDGLEFDGKILKATGTGGTEDYPELKNKPSINGVELNGNKTSEDLGIASKDNLDEAVAILEEAIDDIVDDLADHEERIKALEEGGGGGGGGTSDHRQLTNRDASDQHPISAITGLAEKLGPLENAKETQQVEIDTVPTEDSEHLITSGAVYSAVSAIAYEIGVIDGLIGSGVIS